MYQYIYDNSLNDKKYDRVLSQIESRLIDLGINGKINKLTILKNVETYIREVTNKKTECLVVVGNDETVAKMLNIIADKDIVLGIISVGQKNTIADFFGIPREVDACDILAARKIEEIDIGLVGGQYFLSSVEVFGEGVNILCNNKYEIKTLPKTEKIGIYNLCLEGDNQRFFKPQDNKLELVSVPKSKKGLFGLKKEELKDTVIKIKKARVLSSPGIDSVIVDSSKVIKTPVEISVAKKKLKVIVGKNRKF